MVGVAPRDGHFLHFCAFDAWRRLIFLGAGELHEEWIAGVIGVRIDDLRGSALDERLRADLRVLRLLEVREVRVKAAQNAVSFATRVAARVAAGEKLSKAQRKRLKREREAESA